MLTAIRKITPDMIFLDINMDDVDGLSLAGRIRGKYGGSFAVSCDEYEFAVVAVV